MGLILASGSPRRKTLLQLITQNFEVCPALSDENPPSTLPAQEVALYLAKEKAREVSRRLPNDLCIGADTTVILDNQILGKPGTPQNASRMLHSLSGQTHTVVTGVALAQSNQIRSAFSVSTQVKFYPLTDAQIDAYVQTGEPLDKAGGYGIQGYGALLVQEIQGDYYAVVGLPVAPLARELDALGIRFI